MQMEKLYSDLVGQLEQLIEKDTKLESRLKWFKQQHKSSKLTAYGIRTPEIRKLIRRNMKQFQQLSLLEKFDLAKMLFKSGNFEQATIGDTIIELGAKTLTPSHFDLFDEVADCLNNWASVDWLCLRVLQPLLLKYREETLNLLRKWNISESEWKRRASVVAFVRKIGSSGSFTDEVLEFCEKLILDEEDIVQKGVGWALKDNLPGAKNRIIEYIKSLKRNGISSTIILYAIRDLKGKEREEIMNVKPE
jgi:3-methyladenine DNA glycosylase AlkD